VVVGVGNGDPICIEPPQSTTRSAFHGLARAIVRTTQDSASPAWHRKRLLEIMRGPQTVDVVPPGQEVRAATYIQVTATAQGIAGSVSVTIGLSQNPAVDGVLAVAQANSANVTLSLA
jgi:hypothetical protein